MSPARGKGIRLILCAATFVLLAPAHAEELQTSLASVGVEYPAEAPMLPQELPASDIDRLFLLYKDARAEGSFDEADTLAKRIVDASIASNGIDSKVTAIALTNLGMLQLSLDESISAAQNFTVAIDVFERIDNRLSSDLITPLRGLGRAQQQAGHPDRAIDAWKRAVHIGHVNFGPHNYDQVETLYSIAKLLYDAGATDEASKIYKRISYLHTRYNGKGAKGSTPRI